MEKLHPITIRLTLHERIEGEERLFEINPALLDRKAELAEVDPVLFGYCAGQAAQVFKNYPMVTSVTTRPEEHVRLVFLSKEQTVAGEAQSEFEGASA